MKVHLVEIMNEKGECMCLNEFRNPKGCQVCATHGSNLIESKLESPKDITDKCNTCDGTLINFLDLPNEQKITLWEKEELDILVEKRIYCPNCRITYGYSKT